MTKAILKTEVLSANAIIEPDGFTSIRFINTGNDNAKILDNIPILSTKEFFVENLPGTIIEMPIAIKFAGTGDKPGMVVVKYYYY